LAAGSYSFQAHYNGDSNFTASTSDCEPLTVNKAPTTITTQAQYAGTTIVPGSTVTDTATVSTTSSFTPGPSGTVNFFLCDPGTVAANGGDCHTGGAAAGSGTLSGGKATSAPPVTVTTAGTYCWRAVYVGDSNFTGSTDVGTISPSNNECFSVFQMLHPGTIGFWRNWNNHYTQPQFQSLVNWVVTNNCAVYATGTTHGGPQCFIGWFGQVFNNNTAQLTIPEFTAIMTFGKGTPRGQMVLAQLTGLKLDLAISANNPPLTQFNDNLCTGGLLDLMNVPGALAFFGTITPTVQQVLDKVEPYWIGNLGSTNPKDWKFGNPTTKQEWSSSTYDMIITVLTGMNEGSLVTSSGC
jgi:hypothetical protein